MGWTHSVGGKARRYLKQDYAILGRQETTAFPGYGSNRKFFAGIVNSLQPCQFSSQGRFGQLCQCEVGRVASRIGIRISRRSEHFWGKI